MNYIKYRFTLDRQKSRSQVSIPVRKNDMAVGLYINLQDAGEPFYMEDGCTALIFMRKPNGELYHRPCVIDGNITIRYEFSHTTAVVEGIYECEVVVYDIEGKILTSPKFVMVVSDRVVGDEDECFTEDDLLTIDKIMLAEQERIKNEEIRFLLEGQIRRSEDARVSAENERVSAEEERVLAENKRASSEEARFRSEFDRVLAEYDRGWAEDDRVSAEDARTSAENERVSAEEERVLAENKRVSSEEARFRSEFDRVSAEYYRGWAEDDRVSAEDARISAENNRVSAENERERATQDALSRINNAIADMKALTSEISNTPFCEKVLLYYGYPIAINGAWSVENACNIYKSYDIVVLGDTYNEPTHEVYDDTVAIFERMKTLAPDTKMVGYVPIGLHPEWKDSNLTMDELKRRVDLWVDLGVKGIFLDEYGYDYFVSRERQNEIVKYCHDRRLFVFANSWSVEYCFNPNQMVIDWLVELDENGNEKYDESGNPILFSPNPNNLAPELNENDYYLYENLFYTTDKISNTDGTQTLELKCASVWRIDDIISYYTNPKIAGKSYYEYYGTKICSLDGIPSTMDTTHKNILQSISVIGAAILNIHAVAFGDENWGSSGYFHQWDIPDLDLRTKGLNGVSVETKRYINDEGKESSFPYKWSANINGHTYAIVFDIENPNDLEWVDGKRYATANDVVVENAWMSIFDFQTDMRELKEQADTAVSEAISAKNAAEDAVAEAQQIKSDIEGLDVESVRAEINTIVTDAKTEIDEAMVVLDSGLKDLEAATSGFGFKEVQW